MKGGVSVDFYNIVVRRPRKGLVEIAPEFQYNRSDDIMIRGRDFYAIWDEEKQLWSTDEFDVQRLIDDHLRQFHKDHESEYVGCDVEVKYMKWQSTGSWEKWKRYLKLSPDKYHQLDEQIIFRNSNPKRDEYASKKLPYSLEKGNHDSYDTIMDTLYFPEERDKLEWAIGAIISGDSKNIQKFIVLYGEMGSGKSTFLNILQKLFVGYYTTFDAAALTTNSNSFSMEVFKQNPLVAIQHDGDLSRIENNTKLNSIVSHEEMSMNEKFKSAYTIRVNAMCFVGSNKAVKITDSKSGLIRRLIDVSPSLKKLPPNQYYALMERIDFELGAIAHHCLTKYQRMGKNYYGHYKPMNMMFQTDVFFNFVEENYNVFKEMDGVKLNQAYDMYKTYCEESLVEYKLPKHRFREELKSYFQKFHERVWIDGKQVRSWYETFLTNKFESDKSPEEKPADLGIIFKKEPSLIDEILSKCPAQYASDKEIPKQAWDLVKTTLRQIDTSKLHYVRPHENHIVIDFDMKDDDGNKSLDLNIEAASKFPTTYAEVSKGGNGIHLHYIYDGDVSVLSPIYDKDIEVKVFTGKLALRRRLSLCSNNPVATINSGLPLKGEPVINFKTVVNEKAIRTLIIKNLKKQYHPGTKSSIDFIFKILDDAYKSGMVYDVTDMRQDVFTFAASSTNQASYCMKLVTEMKFKSEEEGVAVQEYDQESLVFYDVEVFPNLFIVVYKTQGGTPVKLINPTSAEIEPLLKYRLVGFNCRRYDNHIMYGRYIGYTNEQLYELSQNIINNNRNAMFREAYNISYTDVFDFASAGNKQGLKKWEIKLMDKFPDLGHQECDHPWDEPAPEEKWEMISDYCVNDVEWTEVVFNHLSGDWAARQILAGISGLTLNDTTNAHTTQIIFGRDRKTQSVLEYTDLSKMFPGYTFDRGKSSYRGENPSEGGRVYAEPGMYKNVPILDIESMHPRSIVELNLFGKYTKRFADLVDGRLAIKHIAIAKEKYKYSEIKEKERDLLINQALSKLDDLLDGTIKPFVIEALGENPKFTLKDVSNGLKTAINSAYGLTSAKFENPFRDPRNVDNIVAKRGSLFMIDLQFAVQEKGYKVAHIKTDSIKIPLLGIDEEDQKMIDFVVDFGKKYGYTFEHEDTMQRLCLVNNAVYICRKGNGKWDATGAQFSEPYVFKTLFSKEELTFSDLTQTKSVTSRMYIDMNEDLSEDQHNYIFIGKVGNFCPMRPGSGGGVLVREKDGKYYAVGGTKGYRWMESAMVRTLGLEDSIDMTYFEKLAQDAKNEISKYGDYEWFISDRP